MPISVDANISPLSQSDFAQVSYRVMAEIFILRKELGKFFDEKVYGNVLVERLDEAQGEVAIHVSFRDFQKTYFMDLLISNGAPFELKNVASLTMRHRGQLLNYLLLSDLKHGKLVNIRPATVEHEFVNATQTRTERARFAINDSAWNATKGFGEVEKALVIELMSDWGTGLERGLYQQALIHFSGGMDEVLDEVSVVLNGVGVSKQTVISPAPRVALKISTLETGTNAYRKDLNHFLNVVELDTIQWINIAQGQVSFETIK